MPRYICVKVIGAILVLLALGCSESGTQPNRLRLSFFQSDCYRPAGTEAGSSAGDRQEGLSGSPSFQSPCLDGGWSAGALAVATAGTVRFAAGHDTLFVYHDSASYNCCSKIRYDVEVQDSIVNFIEIDTAQSLCNCMCHFNLEAYYPALPRGTYAARLWNATRDSLLGEAPVFVPGAAGIWFETRCDTLTVHHDGKQANCCATFIFAFEQQGNHLWFTETDTSKVLCRCMNCSFDLIAEASGLSTGEYVVRVRGATGDSLLDTAVVQIAPCLSR